MLPTVGVRTPMHASADQDNVVGATYMSTLSLLDSTPSHR